MKTSFPTTKTNDNTENNSNTLTTLACLASDFLRAKMPKINAIPMGIIAKVPNGKNEKTMLKVVKILAITKNIRLMILF